MLRTHLIVFNILALTCFFITTVTAQTTKTHTERFTVDEEIDIHINTTHTNVKFETWDKNEVEVTFTLEADEKVEELFEKWNFKATGDKNKVTIESQSGYHFDMPDFQFDFDVENFDFQMDNLNLDISNLNLDIDNMVSGIIDGLNLEDIPPSPFGKDVNFDGGKYRKNPEAYLRKMNDKYDTNINEREVDQWLEDLEEWSNKIEVEIGESRELDERVNERMAERAEEMEAFAEKWEKEHEVKIKEMTEKLEQQIEKIDFDQFQNFNQFDQNRSKTKKTIHIKLPKKAKLHMNVRYGEVTLAENLRNINANLNYASLSAITINGADTDISASYAPIFVDHWQNGQLHLNHCNDIIIKKATKIDLNAEGTDIIIGTLLNSGLIHSSYGDLEIQKLGANLKDLTLVLDYGSALLYLPAMALNLNYTGNEQSVFSFPKKCKVTSDTQDGRHRIVKAYNQKQNSGNVLSIRSNYGELTIK